MLRTQLYRWWLPTILFCLVARPASAQSFRVQCPAKTTLHPALPPATPVDPLSGDPLYTGPSATGQSSTPVPGVVNGAVKCQQISGGDGYATMADGTQTYMFSFGPLSGMDSIKNGQPGTQLPVDFNAAYNGSTLPNGLTNPVFNLAQPQNNNGAVTDPTTMMNVGVLNGNIPAPLMAFDEDDEFFLTLTNVGMIMRPDLFEQHTVHFHGYPNASSFYDGVPDASVAINIGGSFTYYYLAPDAGTYFWHCHITPPEHLQMGMVGQLYVRPRQNRVPSGTSLCTAPQPAINTGFTHVPGYKYAYNDGDGSTRYDLDVPIQIHGFDPNFHFVGMTFNPEGFADMKDKYFLLNGRSYPDTVGVPCYAGGPSAGSSNPDARSRAMGTEDSDGLTRYSQPLPSLITLIQGERALLRLSDLDVTEYQTLASLGIPMQLVGFQAKLLRDQAGTNLPIITNSVTFGGGESLDVILDSTGVAPGTYFLYTPNLDHLSNDAENFGGLMTEIQVCASASACTF